MQSFFFGSGSVKPRQQKYNQVTLELPNSPNVGIERDIKTSFSSQAHKIRTAGFHIRNTSLINSGGESIQSPDPSSNDQNPKIQGIKANIQKKDQSIPATPGQQGTIKSDDLKSNCTFEGIPMTPPGNEADDNDFDDEMIRA